MTAAPGSPRLVVFDIGNVLIRFDPERAYRQLIGAERCATLFAAVPLLEMNLKIDGGADLSEMVEETARAHPGWAAEIRLWRDHWHEIASPAIDHSVALLRALKARGVPVWALSNFGAATFEISRRQYPFLELFDETFLSARLRMLKPEPQIYAALEAASPYPPAELLFVDDRPENITAAKARGWQGYVFDTATGFAKTLVEKGLLTPKEAFAAVPAPEAGAI